MCEFSQRLVAWLDGELLEGEAGKMERHLADCAQCRGQVDAYRQASDAFEAYSNAYADASVSAKPGRRSMRPARAVFAAAAIAAMVAAFFLFAARIRHSAVVGTAAEMGSTTAASQPTQAAQHEPAKQLAAVVPPRATPRVKANRGVEGVSHSVPDMRTKAPRASREREFIARNAGGGDFHPCRCHFPSGCDSRGRQFHSRRHDGQRWFGRTDSPAAAAHGI